MSEFLGSPVDPLNGATFALGGRVATMDDHDSVVDDGVVYVREGSIAAVQKASEDPPPEFEGLKVLETKGTIYPGLIDLHDHLSYNALQLWDVPKLYTNRDQWAKGDTYRKLVTGPMKVLAHTPEYVPAIVRYVECKCLVAGTTTSQGIALSSYSGIQRFYKGIVRNVEQTDEDELPEAGNAHRRRGGEGLGQVPEAPRELRLPAAPSERGHGRQGPRALPSPPGAVRRLGDHELAGRDPLRRA